MGCPNDDMNEENSADSGNFLNYTLYIHNLGLHQIVIKDYCFFAEFLFFLNKKRNQIIPSLEIKVYCKAF